MMKYETSFRFIKVATIMALLGFSATSVAATGSFKKSVGVNDDAIVEVNNEKGTVIVRGADVNEVTVYAKIKVDKRFTRTDPQKAARLIGEIKRSPPIETDGNRVIVGELKKHTHQRYASISYEILVPSEAMVNVHSVSGDVRVSGVTGEVNATSEKGEVTVAEANDTRTAKTSG